MAKAHNFDQDSSKRKIDFIMPFEFDYDFGSPNGTAIIGRFLPVVRFPLGRRWELRNLTLALVANAPGGRPGFPGNPNPVEGKKVVGLGDWINITTILPPLKSKKLVFGFGLGLGMPFATNASFGSGKWTIGPILRIGYNPGKWKLNAIGGNLWSYAGNPERGEVNQTVIRGLIRRPLGSKWFFTSNPILTANWNAPRKQRWLIPVGGGLGRKFVSGRQHISVAAHYYNNAVRQDGAPTGLIRLDILLHIP